MKKLIPILLISVYLISTTEFYQLLKIPLLAEHFNEHKSLNEGTTFWNFLVMHYSNNDIEYADNDKDMRLPFKSNEGSLHSINSSIIHHTNSNAVIKPVLVLNLKEYKPKEDIFFNSTYHSNIWQPPKYC